MITHARLAVGTAHLLEQWRGGRVIADVIERFDPGLALHVGLPCQDVDFQGVISSRGRGRQGCDAENQDEDGWDCCSHGSESVGS